MVSIENRVNDIKYLIKLIERIPTVEKSFEGQMDLIETINLRLGALSRDDEDAVIIRNKYGRYNGSQQYTKNEQGIHFDLLSNALLIFSEEEQNVLAREILSHNVDAFFSEMTLLSEKIAQVISTEINLLEQEPLKNQEIEKKLMEYKQRLGPFLKAEGGNKLPFFENLTELFFCTKLLNYTSDLLSSYPSMLVSEKMSREERYIFAHIMGIVCQTFESLPSVLKPKKYEELFRIVKKTRNGIAHRHGKLIYNLEESSIETLKENSLTFFKEAESLFKSIEIFLKSAKSYDDVLKMLQGANAPKNDKLFSAAKLSVIKLGSLFGVKEKKAPIAKTKDKNKKEKKPEKVESSQDLATKIAGLQKSIDRIQENLNLLAGDKNNEKRKALFKPRKKEPPPTEKSVRDHFIGELAKLEKFKREVQEKYQSLSKDNDDDVLNLSQKKKKKEDKETTIIPLAENQSAKILEHMTREFQYLEELLKNAVTNKFVIEHAMNVIGQLGRDLKKEEEKNHNIKNLAPNEYMASLAATIHMRNSKMHNIIKANNLPLFEIIFRDALPMLPEIQAMHHIIKITEQNMTSNENIMALFTLGDSYLKLKQDDKAIETFKSIQAAFIDKTILPMTLINALAGLATAYGNKASICHETDLVEWKKLMRYKYLYLMECLKLITEIGEDFIAADSDAAINVTAIYDPSIDDSDINVINDILSDLPVNLTVATLLNNCAGTYAQLGYHDLQVKCLQKAIKIAHQLQDDIREAKYLNNLGQYSYQTAKNQDKNLPRGSHTIQFHGKFHSERAIACFWQAKKVLEKNHHQHSLFYINICNNLRKALLLSHHPYLTAVSMEVSESTHQVLSTLPVRRNEFVVKEHDKIEKKHSKILKKLSECDKEGKIGDFFEKRDINRDSFLLSTVTRGLTGIYHDLSLNVDLSHELNTIQIMSDDQQGDTVKNVRKWHAEGVMKYNENNFQSAIDLFNQALPFLINEQFSGSELPANKKRIWTDLGKAHYELSHFEDAAKYFEKSIDLVIKNEINLDDEIIDSLVKLGKINHGHTTRFIELSEIIDEKYKVYAASYNKYDLWLQNLEVTYVNAKEYKKFILINQRTVASLTAIQLENNQLQLDLAIKLLSSAQSNYRVDFSTQKNSLSDKYDFYIKINQQLNLIKEKYTNAMLENALKESEIILKPLRNAQAKESCSLEIALPGLIGSDFFGVSSVPSCHNELIKTYSLKNSSQQELEKGLRNAAAKGKYNDLQKFILLVKDINSASASNGYTALHWAAERGHEKCIELLIKNKANTLVLNQAQLKPEELLSNSHPAKQLFLSHGNNPPDRAQDKARFERRGLVN